MKNLFVSIKKCVLFEGISENDLKNVFQSIEYNIKDFSKEEVIALENSPCNSLGILLEGDIELKKIYASGKVLTLARLKKGDIFGEVIVFSEKKVYPATIISVDSSKVLFISKENILELCTTNKLFLDNFLRLLTKKILLLNQKVTSLSFHTVRQKVANYILTEFQKQKTSKIKMGLTKKEIAEHLGIPRPSFSRELSIFKKEGLIDYGKDYIEILDLVGLEDSLLE